MQSILDSKNLKFILETAQNLAIEIYLVGGSVRSFLQNKSCNDFDFACSSDPKILVQTLSEKMHRPMIVLEEERQIYRLFLDQEQIDFARFKGVDLKSDLAARDFTVNAMALKLKIENEKIVPELFDFCNGQNDLIQKFLRQCSAQIYVDDPLRMLRAHRIAAQLDLTIEATTFKNIQDHAHLITTVSAERIREELLLMLDVDDIYNRILDLDKSGLVSVLVPEMDANRSCALDYYPEQGVWGHSLQGLEALEWIFKNLESEFLENAEKIKTIVFSKAEDTEGHRRCALMKLAILFHDIGKAPTAQEKNGRLHFYQHQNVGASITRKIARRLKFSSKATEFLSEMVFSHMRPGSMAHAENLTDRAKFRFFRDLKQDAIPMLLVSLADRYSYIPQTRGQKQDLHEISTKDLITWHYQKQLEDLHKKPKLVNGKDLMQHLNLLPGKQLGQLLKDIEEAHVLGEISTAEQALNFAQIALQKMAEKGDLL